MNNSAPSPFARAASIRRPLARSRQSSVAPLLFLLPAVLYIVIVGFYPMLRVLQLSFAESALLGASTEAYSVGNYLRALTSSQFWTATWHTIRYVLLSVGLHTILGLALSSLLVHPSLQPSLRSAAQSLLILPWTVTLVISAIIGRILLTPDLSVVRDLLRGIGIVWATPILTSPDTAYLGIVAVNVWNFTPFYMLMILAQMRSIDPSQYEAAAIEGANGWQSFAHITVPSLRQVLTFLITFDVIGTFIQFDLTWLMTNGGPLGSTEVLSTLVYRTAFERFDFGYSAAIGILMALMMLLASSVLLYIGRDKRNS